VCLVAIAAGDGAISPAPPVRRADALNRMGEAQDTGDRLGAQAHLGAEALDQGLAAAGEIAAERADRARAVACLQDLERPGNIWRHGPAAAKTLQQETVHEVEARRQSSPAPALSATGEPALERLPSAFRRRSARDALRVPT